MSAPRASRAPLTVRQTTAATDYDFVLKFVEAARAARFEWAASWPSHAILSEIRASCLFVAHAHSIPVGFALVRPPGHAFEITLTAVSQSVRGRGVFSSLIAKVVEDCRTNAPHESLHLEVRADNRVAILAYEACGFKLVGHRKNYYSDRVDALLFRKDFETRVDLITGA